jgi:hypothetical protein
VTDTPVGKRKVAGPAKAFGRLTAGDEPIIGPIIEPERRVTLTVTPNPSFGFPSRNISLTKSTKGNPGVKDCPLAVSQRELAPDAGSVSSAEDCWS